MSFKFISKSSGRGGAVRSGSLIRIRRVKDRINFTLYGEFNSIFDFKKGDRIAIGFDGQRIALVKSDDGYSLADNSQTDNSSLRFSIAYKYADFIVDLAVLLKDKHIKIDDDMIILDYGKALFEQKGLI